MRFGPSIFEDETPPREEEGRLQIAVFDRTKGAPAAGALARVTKGEHLLEERVSDISGQTPVIELPAPPKAYARKPGGPNPYATYDLYVTLDGYAPASVQGVQIFPDAASCQQVFLRPLRSDDRGADVVTVGPPVPWDAYPDKGSEERGEEPLLAENAPSDPVIPEYVTVHLGAPDDADAPNVWLSFKDYVKNAACCALCPIWPSETLRAGVMAILSFTLNRIHTGRYRHNGFTLTGSAAVDQAFCRQRTVFDSITRLVDDLFTSYVTDGETRRPLPARVSAGRAALGSGLLPLWEALRMGEEGHDAADILQAAFGQDIGFAQAEKLLGLPNPYPGRKLGLGSAGPEVRTLQRQLNAIAEKYPALGGLWADGLFGGQSERAVEVFQGIFRLPVTGRVDFATWYAVAEIYADLSRRRKYGLED